MDNDQPTHACIGRRLRKARVTPSPASKPSSESNVLLVSHSPRWARAVRGAVKTMGCTGVDACGARDALARLAGTTAAYSHLLVEHDDQDGLFHALADLASEAAQPSTDFLLLGAANDSHPHLRNIRSATSRLVLEALTTTNLPREHPMMDVAELNAALQNALFETRYQPIVDIADRRPTGLEALVRLKHPERGVLLPDRFIPQIEDAGLAAELTSVVSAQALSDLAGPILKDRSLRIGLNFPLDVLLMPAALDRLEQQRAAAGIPASLVVIELTESQPVRDIPRLRRSLERLRTLGYNAFIDDVGPAVPQLDPLLALPFNGLKLDKDMVLAAATDTEAADFITRTTARAKAKGWRVIAEGVETKERWDSMAAIGVDGVQGFLVARPLPVAAVPVWWDAWDQQSGPGA